MQEGETIMQVKSHKSIFLVLVSLLMFSFPSYGDWAFNVPTSYPYDVKPSSIVPSWNGANPGEWSFNYEGVLSKAKAEGKYTLLLFTAMWWCPHCQALEANVLSKEGFAQYVAEQGYYLAAVDFPYRDGHSNWCWLWDPAYRAANGIGDWTPNQVADEIIKRFEFQELMHAPNGATTTNNNVLVQISADGATTNLAVYAENPTTVYRRVGYPTIIVIAPDGREAGRFSYSLRQDQEKGLDYVIDNIEVIKESAGKIDLFKDPTAGGLVGEAAQTYDAVLTSSSGKPLGTAVVKVSKLKKSRNSMTVTANVQVGGGKKISLKGVANGFEDEVINLAKNGTAHSVSVKMGDDGLIGSYTDGAANYIIQGARNVFKAKDDTAKARAATLVTGFWPIVLKTTDNGGSPFADGYSGFSVSVGLKGKVKVVGTLGDGTRVSLSSQIIIGENGKAVVPVVDKKGAYSFMLEFVGGQLTGVTGVSSWASNGRQAKFSAEWSSDALFSAVQGAGNVPEIMYLQIEGFDAAAGIGGKLVSVSPVDDAIAVKGNKWTGSKGISDLKVTFKPQDGTFKGSFNFNVLENGKTKKLRATVAGVVVNGVPYGTAVVKGVGSLPIKFVGSCGGGC